MEYKLFEEFITLQSLLKDLGIIQSGGAIKSFLSDHLVYFNGELENRRGKKIRIGDSIEIPDLKTQIILVKPTSEELEEFRLEKLEKERVAKLVKEMKRRGIDDAIINAGGSSIVAVNELEDDAWIVGVENPEKEKISEKSIEGYVTQILLDSYKEKNDEDLFDIKISDESYSTSNQGNTFVEIDNQKYGHILSPKTGYPGKNKQIGIVTKEAFTGDIISTGLYNQTPEKFFEILAKLNREIKVEGYMIDENGKIHYSEGFLKYVINE